MKLTPIIIIALVLLGVLAVVPFARPSTFGGGAIDDLTSQDASTTVMTVSNNVPFRILSTSSARWYAEIQSNCASIVSIGYDDVAPATGQGLILASSSRLQFLRNENLYQGSLRATTSSGVNCVITVTEFR